MVISPSIVGVALGTGFLGVAAYANWRHGTVSNALLALFVIAVVPAAWISGWSLEAIAQRGTVFAVALAVILPLFAMGVMSGGAGKLIAVTVLWLPPSAGVSFGITCVILIGALYGASRLGSPACLMTVG